MSFELRQQQQLRKLGQFRNNQAILGRRRLRLRQRELEIERAKADLPGSIEKNRQQLDRTRDYMLKVREAAAREKGQRKDVDSQVMGQKVKIREAALNLAKQAKEARGNIGKYRHAAFENKKLAIQKYQYAVDNWWDSAIKGLKEAIDRQQRYINEAIMRSQNSMRKAILFGGSGFRKRVIYHQNTPMSDRYPGREGIDSAHERIGKIAEASQKQEGKIKEQEGKIRDAYASLAERQQDAYRRLNEALAKRGKQLKDLSLDEKRIIDNEGKIRERGEQIKRAAEQNRKQKAQDARSTARTRRGIAQTKRSLAKLAVSRQRQAAAQRYLAQLRADARAKKKTPGRNYPQWFKDVIRNHRNQQIGKLAPYL